MNENSTKIRALNSPACRMIYEVFTIYGHISNISSFSRIIIISLTSLFLTMGIVFQATRLIMTNLELAVLIDVAPTLMCLAACLIYLPVSYTNRNEYKRLMKMMQLNETMKRTDEENEIKEEYDRYITLISTSLITMALFGSLGLLLPGIAPAVLDYILPLNESRPRVLPFQGEHFVDEQEYFYEILFLQYINILAVIAIAGTIEIIFMMCIIYTCGLFAILGCKLENLTKNKDGVEEDGIDRDAEIIPRINEFIESHKFILKLIRSINRSGEKLFILLVSSSLIVVSISLVQVINPELTTVKSVLMAVCALGQFFVASFAGQLILNASEKLPLDTYNSRWHRCSVKVQKYFVLIIMKTCKPTGITAFNTLCISFQNFSAVIQTGVSYAMVLKQLDE